MKKVVNKYYRNFNYRDLKQIQMENEGQNLQQDIDLLKYSTKRKFKLCRVGQREDIIICSLMVKKNYFITQEMTTQQWDKYGEKIILNTTIQEQKEIVENVFDDLFRFEEQGDLRDIIRDYIFENYKDKFNDTTEIDRILDQYKFRLIYKNLLEGIEPTEN